MRNGRANRLMLAGRGAALLLLAVSLFLPDSDGASDRHGLAVIIDDSRAAAAVRTRLARDLEGWNGRLHVAAPDGYLPEGSGLERMLEQALWQLEPAASNAVLIASDGHWSPAVQPLVRRASDAGIALFWLPIDAAPAGPRILSIASRDRARANGTLTVVVATDPLPGAYELALYGNDELLARAPAGRGGRTVLRVPVPAGNVVRLDAALVDSTGAMIDELADGAIVNVAGAPRLLLLTDQSSPIGEALAAGGWSVRRVSTQAFPAVAGSLPEYSALIVDDVASTALPESSWRAIAGAVRRDALGLLVLGGPHSFGLGAYRGSALEELLPVVSEPPDREQPAAILFLVDVSGSMGRQANESLRMAREAVTFTAESLRPADRVGLTVFDVEARALLPLGAREDHAAALQDVWPERGSGGTRLADALGMSLAALAAEDARQKLLVLVSDGMLPAEDVALLESKLEKGRVELVALLLDDATGAAPLSALAASDNSTLLRVDDVMRLPVLMREQVESQRPALASGPAAVSVRSEPPFLDATNWPALDAWLVTRPRREARIMLATGSGDPLLAAWTAGAGRVVALPGGLGSWSANWIEWERWPELAAGLAGYVALRAPGAVRILRAPPGGDEPAWTIDTGGAPAPQRVVASIDGGEPVALRPLPVAPGLWRVTFPAAPRAGTVTLSWPSEHGVFRHTFAAAAPRRAAPGGRPAAAEAVDAGLLNPWSEAAVGRLSPATSFKPAAVALALLVFLGTIAAERWGRTNVTC